MVADGIEEFWTWWATARPRIEAAISTNGFSNALASEINDKVGGVAPDLDWELAPGKSSQHAFCLSPKGDPESRLVTEIWKARGPAADATWEFYGARQGGAARSAMTMEIGGHEIKLDDFRVVFEVNELKERVDGRYYHPAFAAMAEQLRATTTYLVLDGMFGEDGVERWLGAIETQPDMAEEGVAMSELDVAVSKLSVRATGEQFAVLRGEVEGAPVFVMVNHALKRIDHLLACMHVTVDLKILEPTDAGLTTNEEAPQLDAAEDALVEALGHAAVYYGRETRRGRRVIHFFAPEDGPAAAAFKRWAASHPSRDIEIEWTRDPAWTVQQRFG